MKTWRFGASGLARSATSRPGSTCQQRSNRDLLVTKVSQSGLYTFGSTSGGHILQDRSSSSLAVDCLGRLLHAFLDRAGGSSFASALHPWFLTATGVYWSNGSVFGVDWQQLPVHIAADLHHFTTAPGHLLRWAKVATASRGYLIAHCASFSLLGAVEGHSSSLPGPCLAWQTQQLEGCLKATAQSCCLLVATLQPGALIGTEGLPSPLSKGSTGGATLPAASASVST